MLRFPDKEVVLSKASTISSILGLPEHKSILKGREYRLITSSMEIFLRHIPQVQEVRQAEPIQFHQEQALVEALTPASVEPLSRATT